MFAEHVCVPVAEEQNHGCMHGFAAGGREVSRHINTVSAALYSSVLYPQCAGTLAFSLSRTSYRVRLFFFFLINSSFHVVHLCNQAKMFTVKNIAGIVLKRQKCY